MDDHFHLFSLSHGEDNSENKATDVLKAIPTEAEAGAGRKDTVQLRKGRWLPEEDKILLEHVRKHGAQEWNLLQSSGLLLRTAKSCSQRWLCKLRPDLKRLKFSDDEARTVLEMQQEIGNQWSNIAAKLPGRSNNDVKNLYYAALRKRERKKKRLSSSLQQCEFQVGMSQERKPFGENQTSSQFGKYLMVSRTENFTQVMQMSLLAGQQRDDSLPPDCTKRELPISQFREKSVLNGPHVVPTTPHYPSGVEESSERKSFFPSSLQCSENNTLQSEFAQPDRPCGLTPFNHEPILGLGGIAFQEYFGQHAEMFGLSDREMFHGLADKAFQEEFQQHPELLGPRGNCQPSMNEMSDQHDSFYDDLPDLLELV